MLCSFKTLIHLLKRLKISRTTYYQNKNLAFGLIVSLNPCLSLVYNTLMSIIPNPSMSKKEDTWPVKAVDFVLRCNLVGNCLGWGSLICVYIPTLSRFAHGIVVGVLPVAVLFVLLVNLMVGLVLVAVRLKDGSFPEFNKSTAYVVQGTISTTLFFMGSALYYSLYLLMMWAYTRFPE